MNLTEEQRALYRAVADGKRVEWRTREGNGFGIWYEFTLEDSMPPGGKYHEWRIAPDTITITIPRPESSYMSDGEARFKFCSEADAKAFIDAVRGAG